MKNISSFVVRIYDGSVYNDNRHVKVMPLTIYFDTMSSTTRSSTAAQPVSAENLKALVYEQLQNKTAVSSFGITGAQEDEHKFSLRTTRNTLLAKAIGTKAEQLNGNGALQNLHVADTVAFELQASKAAKDWSQEQGKETKCKLLTTFARTATGVPEIDDAETVWQCNWVQITEPSEGENIKGNDGTRLWLPFTLRDDSGPIVLYITEQAVVKLASILMQLNLSSSEKRPILGFCQSLAPAHQDQCCTAWHSGAAAQQRIRLFYHRCRRVGCT